MTIDQHIDTEPPLTPQVREAMRLMLGIVLGSSVGIDSPGGVLVDGFNRHGHVEVNGLTISTVDAINAGSRLASYLYSEHPDDPMEALSGDLQTLTVWEAEHHE